MILKNEIFIPKRSNDYMEVRSLTVKGSNFEIGKDLAEIGMKEYGGQTGKIQRLCLRKGQTELYEKKCPGIGRKGEGVADAFGLRPEDTMYDTTMLPFDGGEVACSAIYFPPSLN